MTTATHTHSTNPATLVTACMQCGTCSASCPNATHMDMTPRRVWRLLTLGQEKAVLDSETFHLCSNCYACTLRCPKGLPLTRAMNALKRKAGHGRASFYRHFVNQIRMNGRVHETSLMMRYLLAAGPIKALSFAPLGMKLMKKGKISLTHTPAKDTPDLGPLFSTIQQMEAES